MKNTKNVLITGVTLAITLFTSVQVTAMEYSKLTKEQQELVQGEIDQLQTYMNYSTEAWKSGQRTGNQNAMDNANKTYEMYKKRQDALLSLLLSHRPYNKTYTNRDLSDEIYDIKKMK